MEVVTKIVTAMRHAPRKTYFLDRLLTGTASTGMLGVVVVPAEVFVSTQAQLSFASLINIVGIVANFDWKSMLTVCWQLISSFASDDIWKVLLTIGRRVPRCRQEKKLAEAGFVTARHFRRGGWVVLLMGMWHCIQIQRSCRVLNSSRLTEDDQNLWHFVRAVLNQ